MMWYQTPFRGRHVSFPSHDTKDRKITYEMIERLHEAMAAGPHFLTTAELWVAYQRIRQDKVQKVKDPARLLAHACSTDLPTLPSATSSIAGGSGSLAHSPTKYPQPSPLIDVASSFISVAPTFNSVASTFISEASNSISGVLIFISVRTCFISVALTFISASSSFISVELTYISVAPTYTSGVTHSIDVVSNPISGASCFVSQSRYQGPKDHL